MPPPGSQGRLVSGLRGVSGGLLLSTLPADGRRGEGGGSLLSVTHGRQRNSLGSLSPTAGGFRNKLPPPILGLGSCDWLSPCFAPQTGEVALESGTSIDGHAIRGPAESTAF